MKIPEWVHCVATGMHVDDKSETVSWCGRKIYSEWCFVDPTHAALNGRQGGYLVACKTCVEEIVKALRNGNDYESDLVMAARSLKYLDEHDYDSVGICKRCSDDSMSGGSGGECKGEIK